MPILSSHESSLSLKHSEPNSGRRCSLTDNVRRISVPRRSSSYHFPLGRNSINGTTRSVTSKLVPSPQATFPTRSSPRSTTVPPTPKSISAGSEDSFPFPLSPSPICYSNLSDPYITSNKRRNLSTVTPPTSPDRFIPARRSQESLVKCYRLSKPSNELSPSEKIMRHRIASRDPFRRHVTTRIHSASGSLDSLPTRRSSRRGAFGILSSPRAASTGAIWNVGGAAPPLIPGPVVGVSNGRGGILGSGTNAPMFTSDFLNQDSARRYNELFEGRVAAALDVDRATRILAFSTPSPSPLATSRISRVSSHPNTLIPQWKDNQWITGSTDVQFLDAPLLRDDFYCSVLAYCYTSKTLAVGLRNRVYLWSEASGVTYPSRNDNDRRNTYVSSLSFSSTSGENSILATGRSSGRITLWSLLDEEDRCEWYLENAIACVSFKPVTTRRQSCQYGYNVDTEELLVGDESGLVLYYSIEWSRSINRTGGSDCSTLLAKIEIHTQQICGIAWSPDGQHFATGGNDNFCLLFCARDVLAPSTPPSSHSGTSSRLPPVANMIPDFVPNASSHHTLSSMLQQNFHEPRSTRILPRIFHNGQRVTGSQSLHIQSGREMHKWTHSAAVKAIAFCPWQRGLIATGGGSNDRAIRFFHAWSGACLATINVQAQVTSLIWSNTRREIAATFGYAQPEHQYRIAVFSWPDCQQVVAIPWSGDLRALYAVAYPGGPNERTTMCSGEGERWWRRTSEEGCIVVASSDESVKFHEVWSGGKRATRCGVGGLGWSDILEGLEGVDKEGDTIR